MTFLLDTKTGHLILALACIALAAAGAYWRGHNRGWDAATAHYSAVVAACMAANAQDERTIEQLKAANQVFADAASAANAKAQAAVKQSQADSKANAEALMKAQANLNEVEAQHGDAKAWAATRVPGSILAAIGVRQSTGAD